MIIKLIRGYNLLPPSAIFLSSMSKLNLVGNYFPSFILPTIKISLQLN